MPKLSELTRLEANKLYERVLKDHDAQTMRRLCLEDLFFLLVIGCKRKDMNRDWVYARIREVEADPDGHIDLWAREHFKSSIITFGLNVQDILKDPEVTIAIFSHTRPIAKAFLSQIKRELENNQFLKDLFPDILYQNPYKESPKWSLDDGIIVKRKSNPKEATVEAWGLVDGQPTSKHYQIMDYDDVVVPASVSTPEMIAKTTEAIGLSFNLESSNPERPSRKRYSGTRYHQMDTYGVIIQRGTAIPRIHAATEDGTATGKPVLMTQEQLNNKFRDMGPYIFSAQMLLNPSADKAMGFEKDWITSYTMLRNFQNWNFYVLVDPAGEKKKTNDYTVLVVIGLAPDGNYYLVEGIRDRLNLTERTQKLFELVRKWRPLATGYEKYGMQSDIEHIKYIQEQEGYRFPITELGGQMAKHDRIRRLVPIFQSHRFYTPHKLLYITAEGKAADFMDQFLKDEFDTFPVCSHDDMLDCMARIVDEELMAVFPLVTEPLPIGLPKNESEVYDPLVGAMAAVQDKRQSASDTWKSLMTNSRG